MRNLRMQVFAVLDAMADPNGGARNREDAEVDPLTTAQLMTLAQRKRSVAELLGERYERCLRYLVQSQSSDGHWERPDDTWHSSITAWVLTVLAGTDATPSEAVRKGFEWLEQRELKLGGVAESEDLDQPNTYSTGCAIKAFCVAGFESQRYTRHVDWLAHRQSSNGGFTDTCVIQRALEPSITAYVWHALEECPLGKATRIKKGVERFVAHTQRASGTWTTWFDDGDTLEGAAACLRVLADAGRQYDPVLQRGLAYLRGVRIEDQEWWAVLSLGYLADRTPDLLS